MVVWSETALEEDGCDMTVSAGLVADGRVLSSEGMGSEGRRAWRKRARSACSGVECGEVLMD